jgi:hypothetical protein
MEVATNLIPRNVLSVFDDLLARRPNAIDHVAGATENPSIQQGIFLPAIKGRMLDIETREIRRGPDGYASALDTQRLRAASKRELSDRAPGGHILSRDDVSRSAHQTLRVL